MLKSRFGRILAVVLVVFALAGAKPAVSYTIPGGWGALKQQRDQAILQALAPGGSILAAMLVDYIFSSVFRIEPFFEEVGLYSGRSNSFLLPGLLLNLMLSDAGKDANQAMAYAPRRDGSLVVKAFPKMKEREGRPVFHWSGAYVGGHLGWGFGSEEWRDTFGDVAGVPGSTLGISGNGFLGGVQAGYNIQRGRVVFGVEGDFTGTLLSGSTSGALPPASGTFESETNWIASITGRVGYAWPRTLLYIKGGAAWAGVESRFRLDGAVGPFIFPEQRSTVSGWTIGGGMERAINHHWSFRTEYSYYNFGKGRYDTSLPAFGPARIDIDRQIHTVKIGANYRFGAPRI
jgi:outer membrane immunogenic protein